MSSAPPASQQQLTPDYPLARFPRQSAASVQLFNLLASRRASLTVELEGRPRPLRLGAPPPDFIAPRNIALLLGNQRLWLTLPQESLAQLCATWLSNEPFHRLPTLLRHSLLSVVLEPLLNSLGQLTGSNARLAAKDDSSPDDGLQQLGLWQADQPFGSLQLQADTAASLRTVLQAMPAASTDIPPWPDLPIPLRLVMAQTSLPAIDLLALEPGDVLLLADNSNQQVLTLCHGEQRLASATLDHNQVTLAPLPETQMSDNDDISPDQPASAGLSAADLDVRVQFDLGDTSLPLAELQQLQPGYTFTLDRSQTDIVRLRVGNQVIGHGELVQVDDRLGVRVTTLFPGNGSGQETGNGPGNVTGSNSGNAGAAPATESSDEWPSPADTSDDFSGNTEADTSSEYPPQ